MSTGGARGEQEYISRLYGRLDELRTEARQRLDQVLATTGLGHQGLAERDVAAAELAARTARLDSVENGLCFGRLDLRGDERRYIGRIGILDHTGEFEPLLIDWRAPAARPFYVATAHSPDNVQLRRHIRTSGRTVTGVVDEEFGATAEPAGDTALLAAVNAARTGRMSDIVATIQREQDDIIRSPGTGVLVVQGAPGTGKTAVALHRAAYLLYTQRERLSRSVVLIVGPNPAFLRYIGEVLPSLGETGVLLATVGELYPGVRAMVTEPPATAELKGRAAMAEVVAAAVRDRQRVPEEGLEIEHEGALPRLDAAACRRARDLARETGLPHNQAAEVFHGLIVDALARRVADRFGTDVIDGSSLLTDADLETIRGELATAPEVASAVAALWPPLTPQRLLTDLFASPERLAAAAPAFTAAERALLLRPAHHSGWSPADVPLLDEAAELLGADERAARSAEAARQAEREEQLAFAQEALDIAYGSRATDFDDGDEAERLSAFDLVDAEELAERHAEADHRTPAERAAADRTWAFGHIVVDEAQELTAMAWRLLMRRCPARSMTIVGDIAQTGDPGGAASSWGRVLAPHVGDRWRQAELSVNYRLPAEIAAVAAGVLRRIDPARRAPRAVRATSVEPWRHAVPRGRLAAEAVELAARECARTPEGRVAVIAPEELLPALAGRSAGLPDRVDVLGVRRAKGLEFDVVIVVDPGGIESASPRGLNDLYVALTRATQRLGVVHASDGPPPPPLPDLRPLQRPGAE
ncbi:HelD family protein [Streptomyces litchfieldiae]|uniref:AAA family ATPase n=1 Tax=Streptomyces litchfieldiae TaxID=3075543 RepID=A0ABU2MKL3_9ACTN|nr:ATP-binding domain-containing protein [Streptomyces sp. DSM 44938]MDT0341654.1 AAA family ATPase [Streptomyces sp. DSM 44938]